MMRVGAEIEEPTMSIHEDGGKQRITSSIAAAVSSDDTDVLLLLSGPLRTLISAGVSAE